MSDIDMTPRYAPTTVFIVNGEDIVHLPVIQSIAHPPGNHPENCPISKSMTVLELKTAHGSRWYGCDHAYINSELRMVVVGTNKRDEVRMKWPVCTTI